MSSRAFINRSFRAFLLAVLLGVPYSTDAGTIVGSYTPITLAGTATPPTIDLTATGTLDWVKFGNGENPTSFLNTTKIGNPVFLPSGHDILPLGTPPAGSAVDLEAFTGLNNLNFTWSNGNFGMYNGTGPVDTVVGETIAPSATSYPIGLGATFGATVGPDTRILDVYVQGFNADSLITASLSGGESPLTFSVSATQTSANDPGNLYSFGVLELAYSGDASEILTISVQTQSQTTDEANAPNGKFPNAGFFAATVQAAPVPEPASFVVWGVMAVGLSGLSRRRWRVGG